jgi:hypothetical protein
MLYDEFWPLSQHTVLRQNECAEIRDCVMALSERWTRRSDAGFFTLGAASYLDAPNGLPAYLEAAATTNGLLHETFQALLETLRLFFAQMLGEPVRFDERYAVPGFHVFRLDGGDRGRDEPSERAHFDLQWKHLDLPQAPQRTISFTLPIEVPTGGASMHVWHVRYGDALKLGFSARAYATKQRSQVVTYDPGRIVVHDGFILHAIGNASITRPLGHRITLQGHGMRLSEGWLLYW